MSYRKLWIAFAIIVTISFSVLGGVGLKLVDQAPPIPTQVVTTDGQILFSGDTIRDGQGVWQSIGGQEVGTIWGHGSYVAPDWSADWLHRQCVFILDQWAKQQGVQSYAELTPESQAGLRERLRLLIRKNTYDSSRQTITIEPVQAAAFENLEQYYSGMFAKGRNEYAIQKNALPDPEKAREMSAFFWWTAWAASTNRPGSKVTYTQNWPHETLIGNEPTGKIGRASCRERV